MSHHYSQSVCSPARAALLTGYYPIRLGMQVNLRLPKGVAKQDDIVWLISAWCLESPWKGWFDNRGESTAAVPERSWLQVLHGWKVRKDLGLCVSWSELLEGFCRWHLGHCHEDYLPNKRGFHTFHGFYACCQDYTTHSGRCRCGEPKTGAIRPLGLSLILLPDSFNHNLVVYKKYCTCT